MSVPKSKPSHCFDHSTDQDRGRSHGCIAVPDGHGSFRRSIASVFRVYDPTGTTSRRCHTGCLSDTRRLNTSESKARVRTPAFGLRIGRFISASDSLFSDAWRTIFLFHKNAFRGTVCCSAEVAQHRWPSGFPSDAGHSMHRVNSILMQAPKTMIFETAANLELCPKILRH